MRVTEVLPCRRLSVSAHLLASLLTASSSVEKRKQTYDSNMSFWGTEVRPDKVVPFVPPPQDARLHISQACLAVGAGEHKKRASSVMLAARSVRAMSCRPFPPKGITSGLDASPSECRSLSIFLLCRCGLQICSQGKSSRWPRALRVSAVRGPTGLCKFGPCTRRVH